MAIAEDGKLIGWNVLVGGGLAMTHGDTGTYPRKADAPAGDARVTEPGKVAMTDADTRPFAGLAALRDKLSGD